MYSDIAANKRRTIIIMICFVLLIGGLAFLIGLTYNDVVPITIGLGIGAIIYTLITYISGSRMALAVNGAREIQRETNPRFWKIVENLSITDGLPMPRVFIMDDPAPNAFATGRDPNHAAVCATSGLLEMMNDTELEGVMAHELGHVKNYDIRVSMIAFALTAVISLIADLIFQLTWFRGNDRENNQAGQIGLILGIVAAIIAPIVATLIQLAVSRQREYLADATSALTTRYPEGLESALAKIGTSGQPLRKQNTSTAHMFFANPLKKGSISGLLSTHPPIADRIHRLEEMEAHA
jgi:heat shock protein HtpX